MSKEEKYNQTYNIIKSVIADEENLIANLANICAVFKENFDFLWVGFYLVDENLNQLVLGPFQGPLACTRIPFGKGVCGVSWKERNTLVVPDVHEFEGHIACSSLSNSEIVVPVFNKSSGDIFAVLDIDSVRKNDFDAIDQEWCEKIVDLISAS